MCYTYIIPYLILYYLYRKKALKSLKRHVYTDQLPPLRGISYNIGRHVSYEGQEGVEMAYDPDALDALKMEQQLTEATDAEFAEEILKQNAPRAAQVVCHLATNGTTEQIKFRAATYVCDRVLGPIRASGLKGVEEKDALAEFVKGIVANHN